MICCWRYFSYYCLLHGQKLQRWLQISYVNSAIFANVAILVYADYYKREAMEKKLAESEYIEHCMPKKNEQEILHLLNSEGKLFFLNGIC